MFSLHLHFPPASETICVCQDHKGAYLELDPLCVMDFYVASRSQRSGVGLKLFNMMVEVRSAYLLNRNVSSAVNSAYCAGGKS